MQFCLIINMKLLAFVSIFSAFLLILIKTEENDWTELTESSKYHFGYCYSDTDGLGALKKGERKRLNNKCVQAECNEGRLITFTGCHVVEGDPLCIVGKTYLQYPFPDCCPSIKCI